MGESEDSGEDRVIAERLPDLGAWEFYTLAFEDSGDAVCTVALRTGALDGVEYGIFRGEDGEPSATGAIAQPGSWSDEAREDALKAILTIYSGQLPELRGGVVFDFYGEREDDYDDDDANDDDDS
ncbi:uncharacterized protein SOCE26_013960 [Sorangium cellulosum]|uniref:Uncharacterized protein n=1 Tax=Sorangium cellulosum TaxID=56 RepID=A0A2L0EL28_SORCE|nr:hypothetical protein [Sorangium cellulosum]AUX40001.1 uncharacterized protein SOCE26_013960 [Sorangium cellulosum]